MTKLETRNPADLRPHPLNAVIYSNTEADADLVDSVRQLGLLYPLIIKDDNTIIAGHRRWSAALTLGLKSVPVCVTSYDDPTDEMEALIESNRAREKTIDDKMKESIYLEKVIGPRAKARQLAAQNNDAGRSVVAGLPQLDDPGKTRDKVAEAVGMRAKSYEKARTIWDAAADNDEIAAGLWERYANNELSLSAAYEEWREFYTKLDKTTFNKTNDNIEWAKWTWNPVTGCKHGCPYCYARDIADRFNAGNFEPEFHPTRMRAPVNTKVPDAATEDPAYRNVFVCSMADLFGAWVPAEWIQRVLDVCAENPQWNYLFLTKNPARYAEFEFPENSWVGATVDTQARAGPTQKALEQVRGAAVTFVSCEPLLEPISFPEPIGFNWMIIGGRSKSSSGPEFQPDWGWVEDLIGEARASGCMVYFKPNLTVRPKEWPFTEWL